MKFLFLTDTQLPSNRASALHVMHLVPCLNDHFKEVHLLSQRKKGLEVSKIKNHHFISPQRIKLGLIGLIFSFARAIRTIKPELIYSRFVPVSLIPGLRVPYVIELHDDAWNKSRIHKMAIKRAVISPNCLGMVCITSAISKELISIYPKSKDKLTVIADAAAQAPEQYQCRFIDRQSLKIAYVGSFHRGKGVELVVELAEQLPQHRFLIFGGNASEVAERCKYAPSNIEWKGFVNQNLLWKEMEDIDICLLPNQQKVLTGKRSDIGRFTSPLKMFEYMAYAKPIIASDLPVLKEVLNEKIAMLADPEDLTDWKKAIERLTSVELRQTLGKNAQLIFLKSYTWQQRSEQIFNFLNLKLKNSL